MIRPIESQRRAGARAPVGQKGPRAAILVELKRAQHRTATELARKLGTSLNAIRHHLKELESDELVAYERERRGVGAPVFAYRLAPAGEALFPQRYEETLLEVLEGVVDREGRGAAVAMLESQFDAIERRLRPTVGGAPAEERLEAVTRALADEGYMAEWSDGAGGRDVRAADEVVLAVHNCAIRAAAVRFPEICAAEERFLERILGATVERRSHILDGCNACGYRVRFDASAPVNTEKP